MKIKELIEILNGFDSKSKVVFKLDDDTYNAKGLEIFDVMKSHLRESNDFDAPGDIHIILEVQKGDSVERL